MSAAAGANVPNATDVKTQLKGDIPPGLRAKPPMLDSPPFGSTFAKGGIVCGGYQWEERYKLDGKKYWRNKKTGDVTHKDPYW